MPTLTPTDHKARLTGWLPERPTGVPELPSSLYVRRRLNDYAIVARVELVGHLSWAYSVKGGSRGTVSSAAAAMANADRVLARALPAKTEEQTP